jgi:hypothetical protein
MRHFVRYNSRKLRFVIGRFKKAAFKEEVATGERERVDFA